MKKCPFCAEMIQDEAVKCRHCGSMLGAQSQGGWQQQQPAYQQQPSYQPVAMQIDPRVARCPKCSSVSVSAQKQGFGAKKGCCGAILAGPFGLLCGFCGGNKSWTQCASCGHRWRTR